MVFSNAQTVVMNNQEVDSIILSDGGVLYEAKNISLMLSYSPSTVYYGDTVTLTATLTKKNIGLANKTISFYTESESFIPTTETYSGITYNCYEVNGEGNISFNGNSCIILQNNEIKTQADIYNGKHLIEIKDSKLYIDGDEITTDIDPSKNYKIGIITTATDVTHHFGRLLGSSSTDSNGVASATVVCTGFSSLTATISYKDVSDSANIIVNDKYDLTIESDKDILSYNDNDTATLTATLTKNGVGVENEEITFYEQENYVNNLGTFSLTKPYYCCNFPYGEGYEGSMYMTHYDGSIMKKTIMPVVGTVPKINVTDIKTHATENITLGKPILLIQNKQVYYYDTNNVLKQVYGFSNCGDIRINKSNTYLYSYSKVNSDNNGNATYEYTSNSSDDVKIIAKWDELSKSQIIHNL